MIHILIMSMLSNALFLVVAVVQTWDFCTCVHDCSRIVACEHLGQRDGGAVTVTSKLWNFNSYTSLLTLFSASLCSTYLSLDYILGSFCVCAPPMRDGVTLWSHLSLAWRILRMIPVHSKQIPLHSYMALEIHLFVHLFYWDESGLEILHFYFDCLYCIILHLAILLAKTLRNM